MAFSQVDHDVIEGEQQKTLQDHEEVLAPAEAQGQAPHSAVQEEQDRRQAEAVGDGELGRDDPELELDRQPGGPPDQDGNHIK